MRTTFKKLILFIGLLGIALADKLRGRKVAFNALMTPGISANGTESMFPDEAIAFADAIVKIGSTDRNFTLASAQADIPLGVLKHDLVAADEVGSGIGKTICLFGLYKESLTVPTTGAIAADAEVVIDPANPGYAIQLPAAAGVYYVIGRSRYQVVNAGDPCSLIHVTPYKRINLAAVALTSAQNATAAAVDLPTSEALANALKANYNQLQTDVAAIKASLGI